MTDQRLRPCGHLLALRTAASAAADVHTELRTASAASAGAQAASARLAQLLQDARAALSLSAASAAAADAVRSVDDVASYERALVVYLSLVCGFFQAPADAADRSADASTPADGAADVDADASAPAAGTVDGSALQQPLIEAVAAPADASAAPSAGVDVRAACLRCFKWTDVLSDAQVVALDARHEFSHALLATGLRFMSIAQLKAEVLLSQRLSEIDEEQLKLAYQLLLHAAGVLTACLESLGVAAKSVGAQVANLGEEEGSQVAVPGEDEVARWREEQMKIGTADGSGESRTARIEMLDRVPDLAGGHFPQLLLWIALAQAQELVLLRGVSREAVDFSLMAKLAMDLSSRYKECHTFAVRTLRAPAGSSMAERVRLYCAFKAPFYMSVSAYFQGAAAMAKEAGGADAQACVIAIADFKKAKTLLVSKCVPREKEYEANLASQRDEKPRSELLRTVFARTEQVIDRDLDIMTHRNDSVYYQPIPEPEPASDPVGLVRAVNLPTIQANPIWTDREIATCLAGPAPSAERAGESSKPRESCCQSCIIS